MFLYLLVIRGLSVEREWLISLPECSCHWLYQWNLCSNGWRHCFIFRRRWVQLAIWISTVVTAGFVWLLSVCGAHTMVFGLDDAVLSVLSNSYKRLDAQFLLHIFISILSMFRATLCSSSGESIVSIQHLVYVSLCRWPSGMQVGKQLEFISIIPRGTVTRI
jgi:hypothetical protein